MLESIREERVNRQGVDCHRIRNLLRSRIQSFLNDLQKEENLPLTETAIPEREAPGEILIALAHETVHEERLKSDLFFGVHANYYTGI